MTREEKQQLVEQLHALGNSGDLAAIPEVYAPDFDAHMPKGWDVSEFRGHEGVRHAVQHIRSAFSDWHETIIDMVIEQDQVVTRYVSRGTHHGPFLGLAPTEKRVEVEEISICRLVWGKVAEQWCLADDVTMARQLGLLR
jgi:predicted ester cyclase